MSANPVLQCTVQLCRVLNNFEFPHTFLRSQCTPQLHSSTGRLTVLNWFSREMEWQWFSYVPPGHGKIGILWLITLSSKYRSWLCWCVLLAQTALNMIWPLGDSPDGDLRSIWADNAKQSDSLKAIGSTHTHTQEAGAVAEKVMAQACRLTVSIQQ